MINSVHCFRRETRGNVALIFGLAVIPVMTMVAAAIDYSSGSGKQAELRANADAAALVACRSSETDSAKLLAVAQSALNGMMPGETATIDAATFTATNNPRSIEMTARMSQSTRFIKIANIRTMSLAANTKCAAGGGGTGGSGTTNAKNYEIALVLDTTGSMDYTAGGGKTKMQALREAATSFVNTTFTKFGSEKLKISLVPFAATVNVGTANAGAAWMDKTGLSSTHWDNLTGTRSGFTSRFDVFTKLKAKNADWAWGGCVEALPYTYSTKDDRPVSTTGDSLYVPTFAPDEWGNSDIGTQSNLDNIDNNYMDDGTSSSGACDNNGSDRLKRMGQACKYADIKNARTSHPLGPNWQCTSRALTPLTNDATKLVGSTKAVDGKGGEIGELLAEGATNIHQGMHWGWRTISPNGVFTGPAAYSATNTTKIIVLMTDGVNQWRTNTKTESLTSIYSAYGYTKNMNGTSANSRLRSTDANPSDGDATRRAIDNLTRDTCTNARAKNILIYTVAFSVSGDTIDADGQKLLMDCAGVTTTTNTGETKRSYLATDTASLNKAFADIVTGIGELRITK